MTFIYRIQILSNYMISDFPSQYETLPGQKNIFYTAKTNAKYLFLYFENVFWASLSCCSSSLLFVSALVSSAEVTDNSSLSLYVTVFIVSL